MLTVIWTLITSRLGGWVVGGLLVAILATGGYWYIGYLQNQNAVLTRQLAGYKRAVEILKQDLKTDQETDREKERIDSLAPEQLPAEFERLRRKANRGGPALSE